LELLIGRSRTCHWIEAIDLPREHVQKPPRKNAASVIIGKSDVDRVFADQTDGRN